MPEQVATEVRNARATAARLAAQREKLLRDSGRVGSLDRDGLAQIDDLIKNALDGVLDLIDPVDASEAFPLVLLPVRIESRFATDGNATLLKVRVYPDEIHVDELERGLTDVERDAGRAWWSAAWSDPVPDGAFAALVSTVGAARAEWVAHACTPTNLAERATAPGPSFADVPSPRVPRAVARALPDRFVVLAVQGGQVSRGRGNVIPRDLQVSPIPAEGDLPVNAGGGLTVPPGSEWLVDYQAAVDVGMGVTVTLEAGRQRIDRLIVMGTRSSQTAADSAAELEEVLTGHRFSDGLGLLAQGTATNNSDGARSPYQPRRAPVAPALHVTAATSESDSSAAARMLGVDAQTMTDLCGTGTGEQALAARVNTALWPAGWGEYLYRLGQKHVPGLSDAQRESARQLFSTHVRGRGPAPALRVGAQPYGILPVSNLRTWVPQAGETTAGIHRVVSLLLDRWLGAARTRVPTMRPGQAQVQETLLDVLGSSPVMQGLRVRPAVSEDISGAVEAAMGVGTDWFEMERQIMSAVVAGLLGKDAGSMVIGSLHKETRPLPLPLVSPRDPEFIEALIDSPSRVLEVDSVLQALLYLGWTSDDAAAAKSAPAAVLPALLEFVEIDPDLKAQTRAMIARADNAHPAELFSLADRLSRVAPLGGPSLLATFQPVEALQTSLAEVALSAPATDDARLSAVSALGGWILAMGYRNDLRAAMKELAVSDLEARSLAVAEALDCSSHRLDAWATAIVAERRERQADRGPRGLTLGAYGVVEDLAPQDRAAKDGWIHAPTTRHAIAAGMLRSSHLSHLPEAGADGGPFAIDLSSARMKKATHVLEGVRAGQQLAALVGYQIERGLAESRLARLQLSLRTLAPLVAGRLHDRDGDDTDSAKEAVAATDVVDGLLLLHQFPPPTFSGLRAKLDIAPVNPYLPPGEWDPLTDPEWTRVTGVLKEAADTVDAVGDVMLSESVLQYAAGNTTRAAAAMDAVSTGANPSDTVDVLEAQDSGERLTHRLLVVLSDDRPHSSWNTARPRAQAEPALEDWAAARLGDPGDVVVAKVGQTFLTMADSGFAALDLVYADPDGLAGALRAALPGLGDNEIALTRDPGWAPSRRALGEVTALATSLRTLIGGAQPLLPGDLARPGTPAERDLAQALPELVSRVKGAAATLASVVASLSGTVAAIPEQGIVDDDPTAAALEAAIHQLDPFGIPLTPTTERPLDVSWVRGAWEAAQAKAANAQASVERLEEKIAQSAPPALILDAAQDVATGVFGSAFVVVPTLAAPSGADTFVPAVTGPAFPAPPPGAVRRFLRDHGTVRPQVTRFSEVRLLASALGVGRPPRVVQLTEVGDDGPAAGTSIWLAGPLPPEGPWPAGPIGHLVLDVLGTVGAGAALAGLAVDAWVEDLPAQPGPKARKDDPRPSRARTGLAIRSESASARAPQSVLCAVSPDGKRWTTDSLRSVIEQTLDLARIRMATLERLTGEGAILPALYVQHSALQGRSNLMFSELASMNSAFAVMPFVKDVKP